MNATHTPGPAVRYPHITVTLTGTDGNAFAVVGAVARALRRAGVDDQEVKWFTQEAMESGSYNGLLAAVMRWVSVD